MKKEKKRRNNRMRLSAVILSAVLILVFTAGCGGSSSGPSAVAGTAPDNAAVSEAAVSTEGAGSSAETAVSDAATVSEAAESTDESADSAKTEAEEDAAPAETAAADETAGESAAEEETGEAAAEAATEAAAEEGSTEEAAADATEEPAEDSADEGATEAAAEAGTEAAAEEGGEEKPAITFDGETDLEYNARQILEADETITREGALGVAAYLWQMGFGRMSGYPTVGEVNDGKVLTVFDEEGLFYNILLTPEGKIQQIEDVEGNQLITLGTKAGELVKPPISGEDVVALLEDWKSHGGHSQVVSAYNKYAGDYGRSKMDSGDQWCSETVSAAYAALGVADRIGGMASNGFTYEKNARAIGAWVSSSGYIPSPGDVLITHDSNGDRHTACVVSCDGKTVHTIAGGGSSIHRSSISVGSGRITGYIAPEW